MVKKGAGIIKIPEVINPVNYLWVVRMFLNGVKNFRLRFGEIV